MLRVVQVALIPGVSQATDVLVVFFCILVGGGAPPWHAFSKTVQVLPFSFPTETGGLRRSTRARLEAGVNLSKVFCDGPVRSMDARGRWEGNGADGKGRRVSAG